jgi:hypothetical protein
VRRTFLVLLTVAAIAAAAGASRASQLERDPALEKEVLALDEARRQAMIDADKKTLEWLIDPQATYTHSTGWLQYGADLIGLIVDGTLDYKEIWALQTLARAYGGTGIVTGVQQIRVVYEGKPIEATGRFTSVYTRVDGEWKLVAYHSGPLKGR